MKVVQIPSKLWIGNYEFALRLVSPDDPFHKSLDKKDQLVFDAEDGIMSSGPTLFAIWLSSSLPHRRRLEIALHEITHAINWLMEIRDNRKHVNVDEEGIASRHGKAWSQFWLDNPRFLAWMNYTVSKIHADMKKEDKDGNA